MVALFTNPANRPKKTDAIRLRDKLLAKKHRCEIPGGAPDRILIGELLDGLIESDLMQSTRYIYEKVIEKNIRPCFGNIKVARLTTEHDGLVPASA